MSNNIKSIKDSAFKDCTAIKTVKIQDAEKWCGVEIGTLDANPMIYAESVFVGEEKISKLSLNVERVGNYCFAGCKSLTSVTLSPENTVRIGTGAFSNCISLESIGIP